jgi:hypothetical protein
LGIASKIGIVGKKRSEVHKLYDMMIPIKKNRQAVFRIRRTLFFSEIFPDSFNSDFI